MRACIGLVLVLAFGCESALVPSEGESLATDDAAVDEGAPARPDASSTDAASNDTTQRDATVPVAPGPDASDSEGDGGEAMCTPPDDLLAGAACADVLSGVYAIKTVLDVWWNDDVYPPLIDPGRGPITVIQKGTLSDLCGDARIGRAELEMCGLTLPPMLSWAECKAHQLEVPDSLWNGTGLPSVVASGTTDLDVGGALSLARAASLLGIDLSDRDGDWPELGASPGSEFRFVDHDDDDRLGIPLTFGKLGTNYRPSGCHYEDRPITFDAMRVDALASGCAYNCTVATRVHVGMRTQLAVGGQIESCGEDSASIVGASTATSFELRVAGCDTSADRQCSLDEALFVDSLAPAYTILDENEAPPSALLQNPCACPEGCAGDACPLDQTPSVGPRSAMVRLGDEGDAFDCAAVRAAIEAEYPGTTL